MRIDGGRSEAGADADAHRPRVEAHVAGHGFAGPARVGIAVEVARRRAQQVGVMLCPPTVPIAPLGEVEPMWDPSAVAMSSWLMLVWW